MVVPQIVRVFPFVLFGFVFLWFTIQLNIVMSYNPKIEGRIVHKNDKKTTTNYQLNYFIKILQTHWLYSHTQTHENGVTSVLSALCQFSHELNWITLLYDSEKNDPMIHFTELSSFGPLSFSTPINRTIELIARNLLSNSITTLCRRFCCSSFLFCLKRCSPFSNQLCFNTQKYLFRKKTTMRVRTVHKRQR